MSHRQLYNSIFSLLLLAATLCSCSSASDSSDTEAVFNVATYNIRQANAADSMRGDGWGQRSPVVASLIRFHEFNIFGTQEGYKHQLEELKSQLPGYDYIGVARDDGKEQGEHSAIFYDTEMFDLLDHGDFWLSETPDRPGLGWDAACVRICTWGKFRHRPSGKVFQFFNLHQDHIGVQARIESVKLVQQKMKEFGLDLPTFLTGDFNVDQYNEMYDVLTSDDFLRDSFTNAGFVYALNGTFNSYENDGFTDSRIDHIFVTDDVTVEKYGVLTDSYRTPVDSTDSKLVARDFPSEVSLSAYRGRVPSDHFPVKVKVRI
ncbi:MAG: endonuclease/exonuclease/phosphatase family protein [Muribaculaceae bacterium]|nr:endonuclease/exonuclease/phosphatase family protein [Muribaculaceae bacterium]